MQNVYSLRFVAALLPTLLVLAPALDAAPAPRPGRLDVQRGSIRGDQKLPDSWTSGPGDHDLPSTLPLSELPDDTISSPVHLDKILVAALKTASETNPDGLRKSASGYSDEATDGAASNPREKFMKMVQALGELHKTLNSRITIISKGNNIRSSGKRSKMTADGNIKSTTMLSVVSGGTSVRVSTDQVDPKHLTGKAFKKSLPSTPKKTNKRVCFWKYCSQN
ncbi:urotensin II-related peptide [Trichomycterus rosablanca]|uniref:urotensin II-related peptide n=1 Tax=Trichomycterus rosablanca TaxID=2290929 RepID=UPI002F3514CE